MLRRFGNAYGSLAAVTHDNSKAYGSLPRSQATAPRPTEALQRSHTTTPRPTEACRGRRRARLTRGARRILSSAQVKASCDA